MERSQSFHLLLAAARPLKPRLLTPTSKKWRCFVKVVRFALDYVANGYSRLRLRLMGAALHYWTLISCLFVALNEWLSGCVSLRAFTIRFGLKIGIVSV